LLATIKRLQVPLIAMTGDEICGKSGRVHDSGDCGRCGFDCSVAEEACSLGLAPTASTTTMLALGRCAGGYAQREAWVQGGRFCQSASRRQAGQAAGAGGIADALGEALPRVTPQTKMPDVIYEMSRKKLGVTAVVEGEKLVGVISDGDLRRLLENTGQRRSRSDGGRVHDEESADDWGWRVCCDGAGLMEEKKITSLMVVDAGAKLGRDCASARSVEHGVGVGIAYE
jgi:arabinose-5-phosphate isomerase